jgi:hypothetical protein
MSDTVIHFTSMLCTEECCQMAVARGGKIVDHGGA